MKMAFNTAALSNSCSNPVPEAPLVNGVKA